MHSWCLLVISGLAAASTAYGAEVCRADIPDDAGYKILRVRSRVNWSAGIDSTSPVRPGDMYTQTNVDLAREHLRMDLDRQNAIAYRYLDRVSARHIQPCSIVEAPETCQRELHTDKCITLRIDVLVLHVPVLDASALIVDRPRSPNDTNLDGVPKPLLALTPSFGIAQDSALGTAIQSHVSTDLMLLTRLLGNPSSPDNGSTSPTRAQLTADGSRSVDSRYYRGLADMSLARVFSGALSEIALNASFRAKTEPFGTGLVRANDLNVGIRTSFKTSLPLFRSVLIGASYSRLDNALDLASLNTGNVENGIQFRVASDGIAWNAPLRAAAWFQHSDVDTLPSYNKLVARSAYQKSFRLRPHQTLGVEVLGGYGMTTGNPPIQDRFAGGSAGSDFLSGSFSTEAGSELPSGPVIRSFGVGKLDWSRASMAVTDESFVHFNTTVSIPVGLSRPLIPAFEPIPGVSVAQLLKARVDKDNLLKAVLKSQGYSDADAQKEQDRVMSAIRPAVHFIADDANLWSLKPIALFDYVRTHAADSPVPDMSWPAVGAGVQLETVTAQLQAAYVHSLPEAAHPRVGNFVFRLLFQNLF